MTENEAIKGLETSIDLAKMCTQNYERKREIQCYEMAIKALEEVQQYRAIGTPEELQTMKEHGGFTGVELAQIAAGQMKLKKYQEIGTVELCRMAVRKQTARRSLHQGCYDKDGVWHEWNGINGKPYELCPSCGVNLCCEMPINRKPNYCKECGQKLDWNRRTNDGKID